MSSICLSRYKNSPWVRRFYSIGGLRDNMRGNRWQVVWVLCFLIGDGMWVPLTAGGEETSEPITLTVSHIGPPTWPAQTEVFEPWAQRIEQLTQGRVTFTYFPNQALGKSSEQ